MSTSPTPGAGAWRFPKWYSADTCGARVQATDVADAHRIRYAAGAIQKELGAQGYIEGPIRGDGHYGQKTTAGIVAFQHHHRLLGDGQAGPKTLAAMCWPVILFFQNLVVIPDRLLLGMVRLESGMDPGAQGADRTKSTDRGLAQISDVSFPQITDAQAYGDIRFALAFGANNIRDAFDKLHLWDPAVAWHNNPSKARAWAVNGEPPDQQIADYVRLVREYAARPV